MSDVNSKLESPRDEVLDRIQTAGAVSLPPHLFEQLYLGPKTDVHGKLRQTFGNPTPIGRLIPMYLFGSNTHPYVQL